jgi:membrane-bound lytic murein transglycosylase B
MGQPQFMPSTFNKYAVDFSGNGAADIWTNVPDVFASTANYLHEHG